MNLSEVFSRASGSEIWSRKMKGEGSSGGRAIGSESESLCLRNLLFWKEGAGYSLRKAPPRGIASWFSSWSISASVSFFLFFFHVGGKEVNSFSSSEHRHSPEIDVIQVIEPGSSTAYWIGKVFNRWLIFISCMLSFLGFFSESNLNFMLRECLALTPWTYGPRGNIFSACF